MQRIFTVALLIAACQRDRVVSRAQAGAAPVVSTAAYHDTSEPLRRLAAQPARGGSPQYEEDAASTGARPFAPRDGVRSHALTTNPFTLLQSFDGITTAQLSAAGLAVIDFSADSSGAVGPNHYVHSANFAFSIFDKSGTRLVGPSATSTFWSGFAGAACGGDWSDVVILYDRVADRWFASRFAKDSAGAWWECFAISKTADPAAQYYRYAFKVSDTEFNDYPKFGVWPDAYYMTAQRDKIFPGKGVFVEAFERAKMLAGDGSAQSVLFSLDNDGHRAGMLPADWDGQTPPPAGAPNPLLRPRSSQLGWPGADGLEVWEFHVDWTTPASSTLTLATTLAPAAYTPVCGMDQNCIPQPGTATKLDPLASGYLMYRLAYRNFGDHEAMVVNHTVDVGDASPDTHAGVRWYELRKTGSAWSIYQQATYAPDADHRWIGSAAMDRAGNLALGYNVSGSVYPGIAYAGRAPADPPGALSSESVLQAGGGAQTGYIFFSDYSQLTVDPVDDCTFWYVNDYQPTTSVHQAWATHVGAFRAASCPKASSAIGYTGETHQDYHDVAHLSATLTNTFASLPISGATLTFSLGAQTCSAQTDAAGHAACDLTPDVAAGPYPLIVTYGGDAQIDSATFAGTFDVTHEETTLAYTGATVIEQGGNAQLSAVLKEDGTAPIAGRTVTFSLGAQSCVAATDASGAAACAIAGVSQALGPATVTASFAGDGYYQASAASAAIVVFAFPASGIFVLGSSNATYWSAGWAAANGMGPDAFKGFASSAGHACGGTWSTQPGNSSGPPATVPSYMGVAVATSVAQAGSSIAGDTARIVVVKTDAGYGPAPGHTGTGSIVAQFCP